MRKLYRTLCFSALTFVLGTTTSFAARSSLESARALRNAIEIKQIYALNFTIDKDITKKVILPVSRGFDQQETGLCWAYAFLSALETMYMVDHPGHTINLSRGAMQYINIKDRIELKIAGVEDHVDPKNYPGYYVEGGTARDAAYLIKHVGALQFQDYHDIITPPHYKSLLTTIFSSENTDKERAKADIALPLYFGYKIPEKTFFNGKLISKEKFGRSLLGEGEWVSYAISKNGKTYIDKDPDPDARRGALTHFISRKEILNKIKTSIAEGRPIIYSNIEHLVLIYGIEYVNNQPTKFYIKDSDLNGDVTDYFYQSDVSKTLNLLGEITILEKQG